MGATSQAIDVKIFDQIAQHCQRLRDQIGRVIVGQEAVVETLMAALFCQGHVLIVGVPGLAKTLLVETLAAALHLRFRRIQFTPDMMPSDILGTELIQEDPASGQRGLRFVPGPVFSQLILADEVNRTPPKTQAALLEAMSERQVTAGGKTMRLEEPFVVVATQNPIEQEGTYPLPEAQLDRFMFSLWMRYPSRDEEIKIVTEPSRERVRDVEAVLDPAGLLASCEAIRQMPVSRHVADYAVSLVRATRPDEPGAPEVTRKYVSWGAGPRAGQFLVLGAKAMAAMEGEPVPGCGHVRRVAMAVLRHRLVVNYLASGEGVAGADVVTQLLEIVPEPDYRSA